MDGVDPDTLLEWLQTGVPDARDLQLMALEQLCMLLLMSDNIDRCFESCPPRHFLPALCKIFIDESAPDNVLEVTARAITYYLDVSNECTRRITQVDGAVRAICQRLAVAEMNDRSSKDLAEQCVKVLELMCARESAAIYEAGGLPCVLTFVQAHSTDIHKDTLHSAMSVVTRLCSRMEPGSDQLPDAACALASLLDGDDPKVVECALKCFATLADRYARKNLDAATLNRNANLVERLLTLLCNVDTRNVTGGAAAPMISVEQDKNASSQPTHNESNVSKLNESAVVARNAALTAATTSTMLGILIALCKCTPSAGEQIINSPQLTLTALQKVLLHNDERCCLDALRLTDLIVCFVCEGRDAMSRGGAVLMSTNAVSGRLTSIAGGGGGEPRQQGEMERVQRQLVDAIRQKDIDAFIEAVESSAVDVDHTDDVGQTLLNWASAFGTADMVQYLCERGADVNKGHRSSSLHYAACFGNAEIARILLRHGADPSMRDEHGLTALDKAKERLEDSQHREVVALLENPAAAALEQAPEVATDATPSSSAAKDAVEAPTANEPISTFVRNDALVHRYLMRLLPLFCRLYTQATTSSVRRAALALTRRATQHISADTLRELCTAEEADASIDEQLLAVLIDVFDEHADDNDAMHSALQIVSDVLAADAYLWREHIVRTGLLPRIERRVRSARERDAADGALAAAAALPALERVPTPLAEEVTELRERTLYHWADWLLVRTEDSLMMWCDACALELSYASNGWFWFVLDSRLARLCSNGSVERAAEWAALPTARGNSTGAGGSVNAYTKQAFTDKLVASKARCSNSTSPLPILTQSNADVKIEIGYWTLSSMRTGDLTILNTHPAHSGKQRIQLQEDMPGFTFTSSAGSTVPHTAEATLAGTAFSTGWATKRGRRQRLMREAQIHKLDMLVLSIWDEHLQQARGQARPQYIALQNCARQLRDVADKYEDASVAPNEEDVESARDALLQLRSLVTDERALSTFEIASSELIDALLSFTPLLVTDGNEGNNNIWLRVFSDIYAECAGDRSALSMLIGKLVGTVESVERLPQYLYDSPGGSPFGLQLLSRRLRLKLSYEQDPSSCDGSKNDTRPNDSWPEGAPLLDRTGRQMRAEPLATVLQLKQYLLRMLAKQWFHYERSTHCFVHALRHEIETNGGLELHYEHDFDANGLMYYIGSNAHTTPDWTNPCQVKCVHVTSSDGERQPYGRPQDILSRDSAPLNCHTSDDSHAWFTIDLGVAIIPSAYTLRHARGYGRSALRNWQLLGSNDCESWSPISDHKADDALNEPGSTHTWRLQAEEGVAYRYLRVQQMGLNAGNQACYLSLSGFEVYGKVVDVYVETFGKQPGPEMLPKARESNATQHSAPTSNIPTSDQRTLSHSLSTRGSGLSEADAAKFYTSSAMRALRERRTFARTLRRTATTGANELSQSSSTAPTSFPPLNSGDRVRMVASVAQQQQQQHSSPARNTRSKSVSIPCGTLGTVSSKTRHGLVDITWDSGQRTTHRYGAENSYDVQLVQPTRDTKSSTPPSKENKAARRASRTSASTKKKSGKMEVKASTADYGSSTGVDSDATVTVRIVDKKSMSTTNLFDSSEPSSVSVASTNAAASAESLRHQTASLENLLARSRLHEQVSQLRQDGIPESTHECNQTTSTPASAASLLSSQHTLHSVPEEERPAAASSTESAGTEHTAEDAGGTVVGVARLVDLMVDEAITIDTSTSGTADEPTPRALEEQEAQEAKEEPKEEKGVKREETAVVASQNKISFTPTATDHVYNARNAFLAKFPKPTEGNGGAQKPSAVLALSGGSGCDTRLVRVRTINRQGATEASEAVVLSSESAAALMEVYADLVRASNGGGNEERVRSAHQRLQRLLHAPGASSSLSSALVRALTADVSLTSSNAVRQRQSTQNPETEIDFFEALQEHDQMAQRQQQTHQQRQSADGTTETRGESTTTGGSGDRPSMSDYEMDLLPEDDDADHSAYEEDVEGTEDDENNQLNDDETNTDSDEHRHPSGDGISDEAAQPSATAATEASLEVPTNTATAAMRRTRRVCPSNSMPPPPPGTQWTVSRLLERRATGQSSNGASVVVTTGGIAPDGSLVTSAHCPNTTSTSLTMRPWDDDYVLKRAFSALIPAFDPRPGRTNVNQTQDIHLPSARAGAPPPSVQRRADGYREPKLKLSLVLSRPQDKNESATELRVAMNDEHRTLFYYVQQLLLMASKSPTPSNEVTRRLWDAQYTVVYELDRDEAKRVNERREHSVEVQARILDEQNGAAVARARTLSMMQMQNKCDDNKEGANAGKWCSLRTVLDVLATIRNAVSEAEAIHQREEHEHSAHESLQTLHLGTDAFVSSKLTQKMRMQLRDPLVVAANALPEWCSILMSRYPWLFPLSTRKLYVDATAYGASRAIVWLQQQREQREQAARGARSSATSGGAARGGVDEHYYEQNIGRIKHERVKIDRDSKRLLDDAMALFDFHAERKSVLEISYANEEGTGLGPTLEFYALIAAELQRKQLAMWVCDDADEMETDLEQSMLDLGEGAMPPGYYVRRAGGLFPAPYPCECSELRQVRRLYHLLGILLAKVLQDGRLIDLPLSRPFLKLICSKEFTQPSSATSTRSTTAMSSAPCMTAEESDEMEVDDEINMGNVLTVHDLHEVHPVKARFLSQLSELVSRKRAIEAEVGKQEGDAKRRRLNELTLLIDGHECRLDDLALTFQINATSKVYAWQSYDLVENGASIDVTIDNVDEYVRRTVDFYTNSGIRMQMAALRRGFNRVFPIAKLQAYSPDELLTLFSGDQTVQWSRDDLVAYTEPKLGFTRDSTCIQYLYDVLLEMSNTERKAFLQFTTGCATLPPGGLANLHPRLTIVRKVDAGDGSYPSVNTCVHYLKLPEYSSKEILRARLLDATYEKGFHLA